MNKLDLIQKLGDQQNLTRNHETNESNLQSQLLSGVHL
jgi:hypothetical protein